MWKQSFLSKARNGFRQAASRGRLVPGIWIESYGMIDRCPRGCAWGILGWLVAVAIGGTGWARHKMCVRCSQKEVNEVLMLAGLTENEVRLMTPESVWKHFDNELWPYYEKRMNGAKEWDAYIAKSEELAEYFIRILERVPVEGETVVTDNLNQQLSWLDVPILTDVVIKPAQKAEPKVLAEVA